MRTPHKPLLLAYILVLGITIFSACETREKVSLAKKPQQNELDITVPSFAMLEIVGSETAPIQVKNEVELSKSEVIEENIIPIQNKNELAFKGGEAPVSPVKTGNGN